MSELVRVSPALFLLRRRNGEEVARLQLRLETSTLQAGKNPARLLSACLGQDAWQIQVLIENSGPAPLQIYRLRLEVFLPASSWSDPLWSMQGAAVGWGQDFAFPLPLGFQRENYLGHLQDAEGGGVPFACIWNRQAGVAFMHLETVPIEWWMPVERLADGVYLAFENRRPLVLPAGRIWNSPLFALTWHEKGDFFPPLERYREWMAQRGLRPAPPVKASYDPAWCSWGYEFDVRPQEILDVLSPGCQMGLRWFTLDDRWFDAYGDWNPRPDTFPNGAEDMRRMNEAIHAKGGLSQMWWYPLCAEDGYGRWESHQYGISKMWNCCHCAHVYHIAHQFIRRLHLCPLSLYR